MGFARTRNHPRLQERQALPDSLCICVSTESEAVAKGHVRGTDSSSETGNGEGKQREGEEGRDGHCDTKIGWRRSV